MSLAASLRYRLYRLADFAYIGDVPWMTGVSFSSELNAAGQFQGTIDLSEPANAGISPYIIPARTALVVDLDGAIAWGGIVWTKDYTRSSRSVAIGGSEFWSYFAARVQAADYTTTWATTLTDPQAIAYQVTHDALQVNYPAFNIYSPPIVANASPPSPSAYWVNASYPQTEQQTVDSIVQTLAQQGYEAGGFDYRVKPAYGIGNALTASANFEYPRTGNIYGSGGWYQTVDVGGDVCVDFEYPADATQMGNFEYMLALGGQSAEGGFVASGGPWPLLEQVVSQVGLAGNTSPYFLIQLLQSYLAAAGYPVVAPVLTTNAALMGPDVLSPGDDLRVHLPAGDLCFPGGWDIVWRVQRLDTTVPDEGVATTAITLNVPPVASVPYLPPL